MGSAATDEVDWAVLEGLGRDDQLVRLLARQVQLSGDRVAELEAANAELTSQVARLGERVKRLEGKLDGARREAKRQAAPFSKGTKAKNPKRPGRKPGVGYGTKARRQPPPTERVDEHVDVPAPRAALGVAARSSLTRLCRSGRRRSCLPALGCGATMWRLGVAPAVASAA